jgi:hypothetical protein
MATQEQLSIIGDIILRVFDSNPAVFEASLEAIRINTDKVTIQNQIEALRKQQREFNEYIESEIQALLGM